MLNFDNKNISPYVNAVYDDNGHFSFNQEVTIEDNVFVLTGELYNVAGSTSVTLQCNYTYVYKDTGETLKSCVTLWAIQE